MSWKTVRIPPLPPISILTGILPPATVLLPVLGRPFGEALDHGELHLTFHEGKFFVRYFESIFPIASESDHQVLSHRSETWEKTRQHSRNFPASLRAWPRLRRGPIR